MEKILDVVNKNVPDTFKKFQDIKKKIIHKDTEKINELITALNKHQSEREHYK
jgi:hypothetical protein